MENTVTVIRMSDLVEDLQELRGADVKIFGQKTTLDSQEVVENDELTIDTIKVLKSLESFTVETIEVSDQCPHCEGNGIVYGWDDEEDCEIETECEECDGNGYINKEIPSSEALERLEEEGILKEKDGNNTYNWCSPLTNHLDWRMYQDINNDKIYVELKAHRYGDVRCNYTETVVLEFMGEHEFLEKLLENNTYASIEIDGKEYDIEVNIASDTNEVYHEGEYVTNICVSDLDEARKELEEYLA